MKPYYQDAAVTIYPGDCRQIVPTLGRFDLLLTDPPYGIGKWTANATGGFMTKAEAGKLTWDKDAPPPWVLQMCISSAAEAIVWGGNYMDLPPAPRVLVWDKQNAGMHFAEAEIAWTNFDRGTTRLFSKGIKSTEIFGANSERQHPTQKPLELIAWCLGHCPDAKSILDPFMGSGTTLRAAKDLGRRAVGIELEERYCEIAALRMGQEVLDLGAA